MNNENSNVATNATQGVQTPVANTNATTVNVDYDKMAEALEKRSNGFMKTYLKEQGLSEDEMREAIKIFKNNKIQKDQETHNNLTNVQNQLQATTDENKRLKIENIAYTLSDELKVDKKTLPYLIKMADFNECFDEKGVLLSDKVKEALSKVLEDIPNLKTKETENKVGITVGADTSNSSQPSGNLFGFAFNGVRKH